MVSSLNARLRRPATAGHKVAAALAVSALSLFAPTTRAQDASRAAEPPPDATTNYVSGTAYVCELGFLPKSPFLTDGLYGGIQFSLNTLPFCGGTQIRWGLLQSKGASYGDPNYQYSESGIDRLYQGLDHAALTGRKVYYSCWPYVIPCQFVRLIGK